MFFCTLAEDKQKSIDIESACELLNVVLGFQFPSQVEKLVEYLKVGISYSPMPFPLSICVAAFLTTGMICLRIHSTESA